MGILTELTLTQLAFCFLVKELHNLDSSRRGVAERSLFSDHRKSVCVIEDDGGLSSSDPNHLAVDVASRLSLPLVRRDNISSEESVIYSHALSAIPYESFGLVDYAIGIEALDDGSITRQQSSSKRARQKRRKRNIMKPFIVDFCPPLLSRLGKRSSGSTGSDLLTKAVAPRKVFEEGATVHDLTAGFGQDSLLIATAGARHVTMVERDPIMAFLLEDALRRLRLLSEKCEDRDQRALATNLATRLSLQVGDGRSIALDLVKSQSNDQLPDIVYLDPMFPARTKKANVKKNMQILHSLLQSQDSDASPEFEETALLEAAYSIARVRVVVKRPVNAPPLGLEERIRPSYAIEGSVNRWDVYVK